MTPLVLASGNAGKLREFADLLAPMGWQVHPQSEFAVPEAEETGLTFVENALIKARNAARHTGSPALADDSGIEVDALKGAPGVFSARYAGPHATDEENNAQLLRALAEVPEAQRSARYWCVLTFLRHADDPTPVIVQASWEGRVLMAPEGEGGFGYDPLFWVPERQMSAAALDKAEKNKISHRGRASALLLAELKTRFS
ncbi:non-canonical purine NTP pyrophosphatase, RdgB/HAM1 family [Terasakiispira papahanaumokuakeensis]|uniref:dITP/XTP pyrophosphatase n=1 Tax=Terasakiispira papahanaumokuakeensis TaxID=197479 RepID=A0A1E2VCK0_9GAMM|nr:non-canonical purine NTP pyrophosphatase, RdgB/HAM1 family [Terasakiispira papahanaumokuakeensis]